jgi:hypothetical protein
MSGQRAVDRSPTPPHASSLLVRPPPLLGQRPLPPLAVGLLLGLSAILSVRQLPDVLHMSPVAASLWLGPMLLSCALLFPALTLRVVSALRLLPSPPLKGHGHLWFVLGVRMPVVLPLDP